MPGRAFGRLAKIGYQFGFVPSGGPPFPENFQNVGRKRSGACFDMSGVHSGDRSSYDLPLLIFGGRGGGVNVDG